MESVTGAQDIPRVCVSRQMGPGLRIARFFTTPGSDPLAQVKYERRTSRITNTDGSVVFEMEGVEVPESWSQVATDIVASKYFRKTGLPTDLSPEALAKGEAPAGAKAGLPAEALAKGGGEWSVRQVVGRLAGCWRHWGERYGYFDTVQDAQAFEDELKYMLVHQMAAPNSPQWFNTGLHFAYGITGPAQGHYCCDPATGDVMESADAYTRPQPHACFIQSVADDMVAPGGIMDLWTREARLFKYGSGTGTNFSEIRGEGEPLSGGGQSSGLMSFLKIGDRAAGAIKSGGTTRRAAKMVCLDLDHPDIEAFISWKMKEEEKVVAMRRAGYSADFNGEAYQTVSGQNSNNSVRIPHEFFQALDRDGDWELVFRTERRAAAMEHRKAEPCRVLKARDLWEKIATAAWRSADPGVQYDTTINDWHTCPEDGRIRASNPCSEYMFLDNTACNLASLNLLKFYPSTRPPSADSLRASLSTRVYPERAPSAVEGRAEGLRAGPSTRVADGDARSGQVLSSFDTEGFRHAVRLWTIVLEISVLMAQFPSREIARLSYDFRTLGLGYANLGALLMQMGIPYDSERARNIAAAITAILTGESYVQSARMAEVLGPFPGYARNRSHMLRVMRNHRRAAEDAPPHEYEKLHVIPAGVDRRHCPPDLLEAAHGAWDAAVDLGERHGYRNAQTTCLAPTGTIGLLMDCDTTGVEPDFALVKFKKLAGGGYMRIANRSVKPALRALGYTEEQVGEIMTFVLGTMTLRGAPHVNEESLREKGFNDDDIASVERRLPQVFDLPCAFSRWTLGAETMERLGFPVPARPSPARQRSGGGWRPDGRPGGMEEQNAGADFNMLRALGFTTKEIREANEAICGRMTIEGAPYIREEHLKVFDCANRCGTTGRRFIRPEGHIRMLAAVQPFISGSISKTINLPNESAIEDVKQCYLLGWKLGLKANAIYRDGCKMSQPLSTRSDADTEQRYAGGGLQPADPGAAREIREKVVIKEVPRRRKLPDERRSITHKFSVAGHEGYVTVGLYEDGKPGEIFIKMAKEGSTLSGVMDTLALSLSMNLQYGVPLDVLVHKLVHTRFEPAGRTGNREIPMVKSMMDYLGRWLALKFLPKEKAKEVHTAELVEWAYAEGSKSREMFVATLPVVDEGKTAMENGEWRVEGLHSQFTPGMPLAFEVAPDSPMCHQCGSTMIRNGACYKCLDCGETEGCS